MTLNEFKAWLEGFSDAMGDTPTPEQWAKIKAKLATVRDDRPFSPSIPAYPRSPSVPGIYGPTWTCGTQTLGVDAVATNGARQ
mgnify:CR=1 FL=1